MTPIPAGRFRIGAAGRLPEEAEASVRVQPFCLGRTEVTNRQFAAFVETTGYTTQAEQPLSTEQFLGLSAAERRPGSVVFRPPSPVRPSGSSQPVADCAIRCSAGATPGSRVWPTPGRGRSP